MRRRRRRRAAWARPWTKTARATYGYVAPPVRAACRRCIALPRATLALSPSSPRRHVLTRHSRAQAVEPSVKVDREEKGIMQYAPVAGVAALALLLIPFLPALFAANPDQG